MTIRTLDLGADKQAEATEPGTPLATNPALGLRAIRLCLRDPALFLPQLRAILRVSALGPVRMMVPMLSGMGELTQILSLVDQTKEVLESEGLAFDTHLPVGGMIEVPAAAVAAPFFARRLKFLSIGTNDLIQYTLAIDRGDDQVNYLYDPLHPAVLRLIHMVIDAGEKAGTPVAMCGEMAGDPRYTRLLLALGLREFSMHPSSLLEIKEVIHRSELARLRRMRRRILACSQEQEIRTLVESL